MSLRFDYDGNGRVDLRHSVHAGAPFGEGTANFEVMREWNQWVVYRKTMVLFAERLAGP